MDLAKELFDAGCAMNEALSPKKQVHSPLPWTIKKNKRGTSHLQSSNGYTIASEYSLANGLVDLEYIAKTANAFPKLVKCLRQVNTRLTGVEQDRPVEAWRQAVIAQDWVETILSELGEL